GARSPAGALALDSADPAYDPPFLRGDRLDREARLPRQHHVFQARVGFHGLERQRVRQRPHRPDVHGSNPRGIVGGIRIGFADHLDDANDLLLLAGMVEERVIAEPHRLEMLAGAKVAHPGPWLALAGALDLIVPGERIRLGLPHPIPPPSLPAFKAPPGTGGVRGTWMAVPTGSRPSSPAATAAAIGISTLRAPAISTSTEAVNTPSTILPRCASSGERPSPSAIPTEKLRDWRLEQVSIRSPSPERPVGVPGRAPKARPKRTSSAKPRVTSAAAALGPSLRPSTIPAAIASTFLAAPPISTPRTSVE